MAGNAGDRDGRGEDLVPELSQTFPSLSNPGGGGEGEVREPFAGPSDLEDKDLIGTTLANRYRVEEAIGRGGLGRVFRVRHVTLEKVFALKILNRTFSSDADKREQFYREAKVASAMMHPSIISVIDFGEDHRVGAFMVMEYLDGEVLSERLRPYPQGLPVKVFCDVVGQIAEALQHIHDQGVVHGDIKPDNVLCFQVDYGPGRRRRWQTKLLDFGMASLRSSDESTVQIGGTPAYLAPERIRGYPQSAAADLYSLGVLCYELLTGYPPFSGHTRDILTSHLDSAPEPIPDRRGEAVDERVIALVERAMAKDPADRHASAAAFRYELRTAMDMLGMTERRRAPPSPTDASAERRRQAAALGFELSPLPMAGINTDGRILCANRQFARFLTGDEEARVTGETLFASSLLDVYPSFLAELRGVVASGEGSRRDIAVRRSSRARKILTFLLRPGEPGAFGDVHITVVAEDESAPARADSPAPADSEDGSRSEGLS